MFTRKQVSTLTALAATTLLGTSALTMSHAQGYRVTSLSGGSPGTGFQITGTNRVTGDVSGQATIFGATTLTFNPSIGFALNDAAGIYGGTADAGTGVYQPFIGDFFGTSTFLQPLSFGSGASGAVYSINDYGYVTGESFDEYGTQMASLWIPNGNPLFDGFSVFGIPTLGGFDNIAYSMNNSFLVVGSSDTSIIGDPVIHAFLFDFANNPLGPATDLHPALATLPTNFGVPSVSEAFFISNDNYITGYVGDGNGLTCAYLYNNTAGTGQIIQTLDTVPGNWQTTGFGLANSTICGPTCFNLSRVVGTGLDLNNLPNAAGVIWKKWDTPATRAGVPGANNNNSKMRFANSLLSSADQSAWDVQGLYSINSDQVTGSGNTGANNGGKIVGLARNRSTGVFEAVRLDPIDWVNVTMQTPASPSLGFVGAQRINGTFRLNTGTPGLVNGQLGELCTTPGQPISFPLTRFLIPSPLNFVGFSMDLADVPVTTDVPFCAIYQGNAIQRSVRISPWLNRVAPGGVQQHRQGEAFQLNLSLNATAPVNGLPVRVTITDLTGGGGSMLTVNGSTTNPTTITVPGGMTSAFIPLTSNTTTDTRSKLFRVDIFQGAKTLSVTVVLNP